MQSQPLTSPPNFQNLELPSDTVQGAAHLRSSPGLPNVHSYPVQPISSSIANNLTRPQSHVEPVSPLYNRSLHTSDINSTGPPAHPTRYSTGEVSALDDPSRPTSVTPESNSTESFNPRSSYSDPHTPTKEESDAEHAEQRPLVSPVSVSTGLRSPSSSNRTPTQSDFLPNNFGPGLPSPPTALHSTATLHLRQVPDQSSYNLRGPESSIVPKVDDLDNQAFAPNLNVPAATTVSGAIHLEEPSNDGQVQATPSSRPNEGGFTTPQRRSEDSEGTFHTADSGEDFVMRHQPSSTATIMPHSLPRPVDALPGSRLVSEARKDIDGRSNKSASAGSATTGRASNKSSRPFSFISFGQVPMEDLTLRGHSIDNSRVMLDKDLPLTPVTPQQSTSEPPSQLSGVRSDTQNHASNDTQNTSTTRPRSYSRPFQDPNLSQHPAFRLEDSGADANNMPLNYYSPRLPRDQAMIQQTTEYQLEGIGPPPAKELNVESRSRRSSPASTFLKRLSTPPRQDAYPVEPKTERQPDSSPATSPVDPKKKKKRVSLFRSLTGHSGGHDSGNSLGISVEPQTTAPLDRQQYSTKAPSPRSNQGSPRNKYTSQGSSTSPQTERTFQRAATYAAPEQDKGKKKRFSGFGVSESLF
jgi:hypothetical protein